MNNRNNNDKKWHKLGAYKLCDAMRSNVSWCNIIVPPSNILQAVAKTTMMDSLSCLACATFIKSTIIHHPPSFALCTTTFFLLNMHGNITFGFLLLEGGECVTPLTFSHNRTCMVYLFFFTTFLLPILSFRLFHEKHVNARIYTQHITLKRALREH